MRKIIVLILYIGGSLGVVFAQHNSLSSIKLISLPEQKVRIDFRFTAPLQQQPTSFMVRDPTRLVFDFTHVASQLSSLQKTKIIQLGALQGYNVVVVGDRIRVILDLASTVTYAETASGSVYSIILNGRQERTQNIRSLKKDIAGKHISLNFQNISTRAVLQLIADFTQLNIVVSEQVQGNITLRLNDIPWEQALDIILTAQGLKKRQSNQVIFIDTKTALNDIEKSKQRLQKPTPLLSALLQINYAKAADLANLVKDRQNSLLSESGTISVDVRTNSIWIQDSGERISQIRKLVKQLDVPVKQVLIEARIVEVSKDSARDLGIRWGVSKPGLLSGTLAGVNQMGQGTLPANVNPYSQRLNLDLVAAPIAGLNPASIGIALAKLSDNILLDLELSALESEGRAELISSPRLIATNQQPAIINSGQEIPYQESTSSGATAVSFKKAVLSLRVTPQITPDSKILMELKINQDTASTQLFNGVPAILTKEIKTNVLVNNGQTIVLGGIYQQDKSRTITRIPFLGQIPVVGNLFRNTQVSLKNDELLIFITPKIITNAKADTVFKR